MIGWQLLPPKWTQDLACFLWTYSAPTESHSSPRRCSSTSPGIPVLLTISNHRPHMSEWTTQAVVSPDIFIIRLSDINIFIKTDKPFSFPSKFGLVATFKPGWGSRKQEILVKQEWMCFRTFCSSSCWFPETCSSKSSWSLNYFQYKLNSREFCGIFYFLSSPTIIKMTWQGWY